MKDIGMSFRNIGSAIAWGCKRFVCCFGNALSLMIRCFVPVKSKRVMMWSFDFKQYSCNPRYLTEYLLEHNPEFEIFWVFRKKVDTSGIDSRIRCVRFRSWEYLLLVNSAEFLITNCRTAPFKLYWKKRPGQKYCMLWHGGVALKKIEKDAEDKLGWQYLRKAKLDSKACDLMISGCGFQTKLLKESFWYDGEILEKGIPRSDIFFKPELRSEIKEKVCRQYGIPSDAKLVLYAPTFRQDKSFSPYMIDWGTVVPHLHRIFAGSDVRVLLRLHPNMMHKDVTPLLNDPAVINVTRYHDMQELLCITDMLITDYSSSMFDISMLERPCILYATDSAQYNRGYYFDLKELPFPMAESQNELIEKMRNFDMGKYLSDLKEFNDKHIHYCEDGNASRSLAGWMTGHSIPRT